MPGSAFGNDDNRNAVEDLLKTSPLTYNSLRLIVSLVVQDHFRNRSTRIWTAVQRFGWLVSLAVGLIAIFVFLSSPQDSTP